MQKFIAACCCAIVGLQVLIAVPLVTCLVVLGVMGGVQVPVVADAPMYATGPSLATIPPPMSPSYNNPPEWAPVPVKPVTVPSHGWSPSASQDCQPASESPASTGPIACLPPLPPGPAPKITPSSSPPLKPQVAELVEVRQRLGSPIDDSELIASNVETQGESTEALTRVIGDDEGKIHTPADADPSATLPGPEVVSTGTPPEAPANPGDRQPAPCLTPQPVQPTIDQSLQVAADQLYLKAQSHEADGSYSRADQLRELARAIRREIQVLREDLHLPPPSAVRSAAHQEPVLGTLAEETVAPTRETAHPPLLPARAELAEPMAHPAETITVSPRMIILEETEELLQLPVEKSTENPAP